MKNIDKQNKKVETSFWDEEATNKKYKFFEKKVYAAFREKEYLYIIQKMISDYHIIPTAKILDMGCGAGVSTIIWDKLGFCSVGVDISPELIQQARDLAFSENSKATFLARDIAELDYPDHSFDVCFMVGVLHHFPNYTPLLELAKRVLTEDGIFIAIEPNRLNWTYRLSFYLVHKQQGVTPNEYPLSPLETRDKILYYFKNVQLFQHREDDVPFLRQLGYWGRSYLGKIAKYFILLIKNNLFPKYSRGTFFIITGKN
jgi:ubiquinone/menaquinone biosynthesis C-methylase UbiE